MTRTTPALAAIVLTANLALAVDAPKLPHIIMPQEYEAARRASTNKTGANHDSMTVAPGATVEFARIDGPAIINHCWFTMMTDDPRYLSNVVLRIRWDGASAPAVESPWGPFFGLGHDECADVVSAPITVTAGKASYIKYPPGLAAFNCYFVMPFHKQAVFTITNGGDKPISAFFFQIDYQRHRALPDNVRHFHATYRTEMTAPGQEPNDCNTTAKENYVILDTAGDGHYVGCTLHVDAPPSQKGKWYEGDDMIVVDDQPLAEGILGTGTEDYFGLAWGVRRMFQAPYHGVSYLRWPDGGPEMTQFGQFSMYRWHLLDPIPFRKSIRVTIEHGHNNDTANRYASVAYWYARKP